MTTNPSTESTAGPDSETRDRLARALHLPYEAERMRSLINDAGSRYDWAGLEGIPGDEHLDDQAREWVRRRLAEMDEFFGSGDNLQALRDFKATSEWQAVVDSGWMAADAPASDVVLVLVRADRVMEGPYAPPTGEPLSFHVDQRTDQGATSAVLLFSGRLVWGGDGGRDYTVSGSLIARSNMTGRSTVWLQYGATDEKWRDSEETEASQGGSSTREITITGTVPAGQQLELRLGTWSHAGWKYSPKQTFTPAG
ncbi:hypothetical protein ACIA8O_03380 [Kitasatospora sp. NPDC051853]|uniref:hypothetical protein n=1 Tax=Kitasatospora sp. NPDC051853 TaxID=3364058 RepID=UPI0037BB99C2